MSVNGDAPLRHDPICNLQLLVECRDDHWNPGFDDPTGDGSASLDKQALYANSPAVSAGRVIELGVEDSNAAYFDSVLNVRRNLALIERVISELT